MSLKRYCCYNILMTSFDFRFCCVMQTLHASIYEQSLYCDIALLSITEFLKPNPYFRNVDKMQLCNDSVSTE